VLNLPRWATDCLKRRDPALVQSGRPFALYEKHKSALKLVAVDEKVSGHNVWPGHNLSDARALIPNLEAREIDRPLIESLFAEFADWHSYASPIVAVLPDMSAFGDLALDITGVAHLFGGEGKMLASVVGRLEALGLEAHGAIASSIGAAWALAQHLPGRIVEADGNLDVTLARLPVSALRLTPEQVATLQQLGLKRIGQLYDYPRRTLQARLGASLIARLDQARGLVDESITPRIPAPERFVERRFAEPISLLDSVLETARDLAIRLAADLEAEGVGAQAFHLMVYRVDHKVMCLSARSAGTTRDPLHVTRLFAQRAERLAGEFDAGFGIDMIRLGAAEVSQLDSLQVGAFDDEGGGDLLRLHDRMANRLGETAVLRTVPVGTHMPERAARLESVIQPAKPASNAFSDRKRPLRLLPNPEPIRVTAEVPEGPPADMTWRRVTYRFVKAAGPERLGEEWWLTQAALTIDPPPKTGEDKPRTQKSRYGWDEEDEPPLPRRPMLFRDYYTAEDDGGRRFWLFHDGIPGTEGAGWFLHGFFS